MTTSNSYELVALLGTAWSILIEDLHTELSKIGYGDLRPAHGFVFQLLAPNGATGNQIAEHLGVTKQAASQMVDYLEERGYVTRTPHPQDKRGKLILLTSKGWECIHATEAFFAALQDRWRAVLGSERMAALHADLQRLIATSESGVVSYRLRPAW